METGIINKEAEKEKENKPSDAAPEESKPAPIKVRTTS